MELFNSLKELLEYVKTFPPVNDSEKDLEKEYRKKLKEFYKQNRR